MCIRDSKRTVHGMRPTGCPRRSSDPPGVEGHRVPANARGLRPTGCPKRSRTNRPGVEGHRVPA
eukprot:9320641-Prorocentrum_lima.AAC.1